MGRKSNSELKVKRVRYRLPGKHFSTRFSRDSRDLKGGPSPNIISVRKISQEEILRVGEYNTLPERLMKEFSKGGNTVG